MDKARQVMKNELLSLQQKIADSREKAQDIDGDDGTAAQNLHGLVMQLKQARLLDECFEYETPFKDAFDDQCRKIKKADYDR